MNKVTSITIHNTPEGKRISITSSVINESGMIVEDNKKINRVVLDKYALSSITTLENFAQGIVDEA